MASPEFILNCGGTVDAADYDLWRANFGLTAAASSSGATGSASASAAVPEPSAIILLALAVLSILSGRR